MKRTPKRAPLSELLDAADELGKVRDLVKLIHVAFTQSTYDAETSVAGALWVLADVEDLIEKVGKRIDRARDGLCRNPLTIPGSTLPDEVTVM